MEKAMEGIDACIVYIDDLLIHTNNTQKKHLVTKKREKVCVKTGWHAFFTHKNGWASQKALFYMIFHTKINQI